jgi:hypothetical protein
MKSGLPRHPETAPKTPYFCVGAWFCGTVGGAAGAGVAGCDLVVAGFTPENTEVGPVFRAAIIDSVIDVSMKMIADQVVARESTDAAPRGPNAVWLPCPPNAAARSPLLPLCSNTTAIRKKQTITCTVVIKTVTNMQETPKRAEAQISRILISTDSLSRTLSRIARVRKGDLNQLITLITRNLFILHPA